MNWITQLFGKADELNSFQMIVRALLVFAGTLLMIRLGSARSFGKETMIDNVVVIILGGILSRIVTGASAFLPSMAACFSIILAHRLLAFICLHNHKLGNLLKGRKKILYETGTFDQRNMQTALISEEDIRQGARQSLQQEDLHNIEKVLVERNGTITLVKKKES